MLRLHHALPLGYRYRGYGTCSGRHRMSECHLLHFAQAVGYGYGGFMCSALDPQRIGFAGASTTPSLFPPPPLAPPALTNAHSHSVPLTHAHSHSVPLMPSRACGKCAVCMYMHICIYVCVYVCVYLFVHIGMCMYTERERERERERKASSKSRMLPCHGVSRPRGTGSVGDSVGEGRA